VIQTASKFAQCSAVNETPARIQVQSNPFMQTPKGQIWVSLLQKWLYYIGRDYTNSGFSGTKLTVCNIKVSLLWTNMSIRRGLTLSRTVLHQLKPGHKHTANLVVTCMKQLCVTLYKGDGGISNIRYMYGEALVFSKQRNKKCWFKLLCWK